MRRNVYLNKEQEKRLPGILARLPAPLPGYRNQRQGETEATLADLVRLGMDLLEDLHELLETIDPDRGIGSPEIAKMKAFLRKWKGDYRIILDKNLVRK